MCESLAFNCLFLSVQSLSSNEQGAISSKIIIYSSYACCLGIYTHDLLEVRKNEKKQHRLVERRHIALYWPPCVPPAVRCQS